MTKPIDWTKPVQTRDGRPVWLRRNEDGSVWKDGGSDGYPILGFIGDSREWWSEDGHYYPGGREHKFDLINVPEPVELWVSVAGDGRLAGWSDQCVNNPNANINSDYAKGTQLRLHNTGGTWQVEPVK